MARRRGAARGSAAARSAPDRGAAGRLRPGEITGVHGDGRVSVATAGQDELEARLAVAGAYEPHAGDRVLVAEADDGRHYVLGVVGALREVGEEATDEPPVEVTERDGVRVVRLYDADRRLLFEHLPDERRSVVHAPAGTLTLRADAGDVEIDAARRVRIRGEEGVELLSPRHVSLGAERDGAEDGSRLDLRRGEAQIDSPLLRGQVDRAELLADHTSVTARVSDTVADLLRTRAGVVDTQARRVLERAREVFRDVEQLAQTRAGRVRMVAESTFRVLGDRATFKARRDMKLKGKRIYLD